VQTPGAFGIRNDQWYFLWEYHSPEGEARLHTRKFTKDLPGSKIRRFHKLASSALVFGFRNKSKSAARITKIA